MAKSLNSTDAEVFNQDILAAGKFPIVRETAESLLRRRDEALELTPELSLLLGDYLHRTQGF